MDEPNLPEWLTEEDDGSLVVSFKSLKKRPNIDGTEVKELRMREPTVTDQITQVKKHSDSGDAEVALIANLTEQSPEAIGALTLRQYKRCATALGFFTSG